MQTPLGSAFILQQFAMLHPNYTNSVFYCIIKGNVKKGVRFVQPIDPQKMWRDVILYSVLMMGLHLLGLTMVDGQILWLFLPIFPTLLWVNYGYRASLVSILTMGFAGVILFGPGNMLVLLAYILMTTLALGLGLRQKMRSSVILLMLTGVFLLLSVFVLRSQALQMGLSMTQLVTNLMEDSKSVFVATYGMDNAEAMWKQLVYTAQLSFPSMIMMMSALLAGGYFVVVRSVMKIMKHPLTPVDHFKDFCLPRNMGLGLLIMLAMAYIFGALGWADQTALMYNVFTPVASLLSVQTLAVLAYYLQEKLPKPVAVLILTTCVLFMGILIHPFILVGILDLQFDFRKRMTRVGQED